MNNNKIKRGWPSVLIGLLIGALLIATYPPASIAAAPVRLQPYLVTIAQETPDEQVSIIVQKATRDAGLEGLVMRLGGKITRALPIINAFAAQIQADFLLHLAQAPGVRWISLDAPVYESNAVADGTVQVRDEFKTFDYSGNDGTHAWSAPWVEMGESDGPELGDLIVTRFWGGALQGLRLQGAAKGIQRQMNLSTATAADVSFSYRRKGFVDSDYVTVEVTHDGVTWQELGRLSGPATDAELHHVVYDLSAYRSAAAAIRFVTSPTWQAEAKFYVDQVTVTATPMAVAYAHQLYLPVVAGVAKEAQAVDQQRPLATARTTNNTTVTYYLHNNPTPAVANTSAQPLLSATTNAPTGSILYNYDVNRDSDAGLFLAKGGSGLTESDPTKIQRWRTPVLTTDLSLNGEASITLYAAMKHFQNKRGILQAYLIERNGASTTVIGSSQFTKLTWGAGWQSVTISWGVLGMLIPAGRQLEIAVIVGTASDDDMWLAYGTKGQASRVTLPVGCFQCINTTTLESTHVTAIAADQLWNEAGYVQGQDVTVAVVDSGISQHNDLYDAAGNSRILAQVDFTDNQGLPDDYYGHGTHVAGIIGGNGALSGGKYMGIAPKVNLVDVRVTNDLGIGNMSDVVAGIQWIYDNKDFYNIRIANLSLNSTVPESYHTSPLNAALEILWFNGVVVVVSAGNNGNSGILYPPANDPFVITAGAVDTKGTASIWDDLLATFSDHGTTQDGFAKPDLIVPGANIIAALASNDSNLALNHPAHTVAGPDGNYYFRMSGTSMAAAVTAGSVALLLQDEPNLTPDQVKYRLTATATTFFNSKYLNTYAAVRGNSTTSANTGITASQLLWSGSQPVAWNSVSWNSVSWNSVSWNSVSWNSVSWNSVSRNSVHWDD